VKKVNLLLRKRIAGMDFHRTEATLPTPWVPPPLSQLSKSQKKSIFLERKRVAVMGFHQISRNCI